jgi:hypothetical protein
VNTTLETYAMSGNERKGVMKVDRSTYGMTLTTGAATTSAPCW